MAAVVWIKDLEVVDLDNKVKGTAIKISSKLES